MKKRLIIYGALLSIAFWACNSPSTNTYSTSEHNDTTIAPSATLNTERGQALFQERCMACHGPSGSNRNNNAADLTVSKADSLTIVNTIINGKGAMPMFAHVMPDADLAQLELYVKTLRK